MRPDRRSGAGLVQQTVQIAAALRLRDLTLVDRHRWLQSGLRTVQFTGYLVPARAVIDFAIAEFCGTRI